MNGHNGYLCCHESCAYTIWFTTAEETRLRKTHEIWKCQAGHPQHFGGKTDEEKRIAALESRVADLERQLTWARGDRDDAKRRCPWSGCYRYLASDEGRHIHMVMAHGMPTRAEVRADQAEDS